MFVAAVKGRGSLESEDPRFMAVINSFKPLTQQEKELARPVVIHVVQVRPGRSDRSRRSR